MASYVRPSGRKTVSVTVDTVLYGKARAMGLAVSKLFEEALTDAIAEHERTVLRAQIAEEASLLDAYVAKHGNPIAELQEMFPLGIGPIE